MPTKTEGKSEGKKGLQFHPFGTKNVFKLLEELGELNWIKVKKDLDFYDWYISSLNCGKKVLGMLTDWFGWMRM